MPGSPGPCGSGPPPGGQGSVWEAFAPPSSPPSWPPSRQHAAARKSLRSPRSCRVGGSGLSRLFSVPVSPQPEDPSGRRLGCSGPPVDPQPAGSPWAHSGWTDPPGAHVPREEQVLNVPEPSMAGSALPRPAPPAPAHRDLLKPGVCPGHAGLAAATSLSDGSCWPPKKPETATTLLATPPPRHPPAWDSPFCPLSSLGPQPVAPGVLAGGTILRRPCPQRPGGAPRPGAQGCRQGSQASTTFPLTLPARGPGRTRTPYTVGRGRWGVPGPCGTPAHGTPVLSPRPGGSAQGSPARPRGRDPAQGKLIAASDPTQAAGLAGSRSPGWPAPPAGLSFPLRAGHRLYSARLQAGEQRGFLSA